MGDLSANFNRSEFECQCGECGLDTVDAPLLEALQYIRDKAGAPVVITSAFRCEDHNNAEGGNKNSYHLQGKAADIKVEGYTPEQVAKLAQESGKINGIGVYATFTHIDTRSYQARWEG